MRGYFKKTLRVLKSEGVAAAFDAAVRQTEILRLNREYRRWLLQNGQLTPEEREEAARRIADFAHQPLISILMPVYNTSEKWLRAAIESVTHQLYPHWELCIADDYSDQTHIRKILEEYTAADERIKVVLRDANGHISAASNSALELATGEFTALMDHDDELSEDALFHIAAEINRLPSVNLLYTDEDKIDSRGNRFYPWLKPDWSPDLFYSMNLLAHLCVYRTQVLRRIGGFREGFEGSQDYDLALRFIEYVPPESICHIPRILYHWRSIRGSAAFDASEKEYAAERARIAVNEHFERTGISAHCVAGRAGVHRLKYYGNPDNTNVSIIIAVRKARSDLRKILQNLTAAPRTEIILAGDFAASEPAGDERVTKLNIEDKGLFYVLNRAARRASGDIIIFLDESVLAASENWISELAGRAGGKGIGAVSPMILDDTGRIIHAGYLLGINGGIGRAHFGGNGARLDALRRRAAEQNFSAVSAACMAIRREVLEAEGGFNDVDFPEFYADVDLCLRLSRRGHRNIWTPSAKVTQERPRMLPINRELEILREKWNSAFARDPFYNSNLTDCDEDFSLASRPRIERI